MEIIVDIKYLEKQIEDLLKSNISEDSKTGLHSLLGCIYDTLMVKCLVVLYKKENE